MSSRMESVPVPAEAYTAICDTISVIDNYSPYLGAEIAAPYVDHAARIDELYRLLGHGEADPLARVILARIRELEAETDG